MVATDAEGRLVKIARIPCSERFAMRLRNMPRSPTTSVGVALAEFVKLASRLSSSLPKRVWDKWAAAQVASTVSAISLAAELDDESRNNRARAASATAQVAATRCPRNRWTKCRSRARFGFGESA